MFLKYLWIKEYGCLKNAEFQFDRNIEFIYDAERNLLKAKEYKSILSDNFWSESGRIEDIHALVGDNGRGKTTFLRAVMDIFTQLYSGEQPDKEVTLANVPFQAIMIIKKANELQYQVLCFGMKGLNIDSQLLHKIRVVDDLLEVRRVLSTVKIAFFSNVFDIRDYQFEKAAHISDYSFGGLLCGDYWKQKNYQREDCYDDPVSEQAFHDIYRQVSFMTEFYTSLKPDEDKKRMFDSWPKTLTLRFIARRKGYKKFQRVQYTEALKKIIQELIGEEERVMEARSAGVPPAEFLAGDKIDLLVERGLEQIEKISERIKYKLCQETFQNLLMGNEYHSYYKASREEKLDNELEPVVRAMYESIKEIYEDSNLSQANKIFYLLNENLCRIQSEEGISELVARYIEMFSVIFDLPEDIFEYGESEEEFYFTLAGQTAENQKKFSDFLVAYKKIVMPYAFLEFEWGMSSGENNLLNFYSKLFAMRNVINGTNFHKEEIVNYISKFPGDNKEEYDCIRCRSLWLLIDEMDLTYHPRWQKKLIADLTYFLPKILPDDELRIQIIFTTHSPILLGDIPKENVIYLKAENGKIDVKRDFSKNTFGQNIYVLFQDSFFLDEPLGKFSADKLQGLLTEIVDIRNKIDKISEKNKKGNPKKIKKLLDSISHIREESRIFGDKVIQYKLLELLDVCEYRLELIQQKAALSDSEEKEQTLERMRQKKMWLEQCIAEMENDEK